MATGASTCDLAMLLIDTRRGCRSDSTSQLYLYALWQSNLVVAVNKINRDYSKRD
ncbi:GTP-binding protein [Shigella flexneri]